MGRKFAAVLCSTLLLSPGWLGGTGFTLLFGLVPLLWISDSYDASRRSWWKVFGWALLTFVLWNVSTIWWIWLATPVGPFAATIASSFLNMVAFMLFHTVSKKGPKALAYTLLVSGWIATEYWYTPGDFSIDKVCVWLSSAAGEVYVCENAAYHPYSEEEAAKVLAEHDILVKVDMGTGDASANAWGCDLTYANVKLNGEYRT